MFKGNDMIIWFCSLK